MAGALKILRRPYNYDLAPGAPAWAHNELVSAEPAAGAVLTAAPRTVTLRSPSPTPPGDDERPPPTGPLLTAKCVLPVG